jgi:hypothetical protein
MLLFLKKVRRQIIADNKVGKYLLYALGEICLVVIGILIALQIDNWNTERVQKDDARKSYENIKRQVEDDQKELAEAKAINTYLTKAFEYANKIIISGNQNKTDSLALISMGLSQYSDFHRSGAIYETLVNSGDLKLLKNDQITGALQHLETTYIFINKLEEMNWGLIINELSPELRGVINYSTREVIQPDKLYAVEIQNIFYEVINLNNIKNTIYEQALGEIEAIIVLINEELSSEI